MDIDNIDALSPALQMKWANQVDFTHSNMSTFLAYIGIPVLWYDWECPY